MKRRLPVLSFALLSAVCLASCSFTRTSGYDRTPAGSADSSYTYTKGTKDTIGLGVGSRYLPSTGTARILVVPVAFSDDGFTAIELERIYNAFFRDSDDTGWESVYSYYHKSSYGKLTVTGDVTEPVRISNLTVKDFDAKFASYNNNGQTYTDTILENVLSYLSSENKVDLSDYDMDGDGYVDAVWLVNSAAYDASSSGRWAFTTWDTSDKVLGNSRKASLYSWGSVDFLTEKKYPDSLSFSNDRADNADAHTFIHETGHMMGLDDYYSYDSGKNGNYDCPVGGQDMMDLNVGDHDMYSKYLLGWISPTVITPDYLKTNGDSLTLKSSQTGGSSNNRAYLIPKAKNGFSDYNGTPFDEYLLVEFYTPTGLSEKDTSGYVNLGKTYSKPGVLVYHVNASIGKIVADRSTGKGIWDKRIYSPEALTVSSDYGSGYAYYYIYNNTPSLGYDTIDDSSSNFYRGRLISLVSHHETKVTTKAYADNRVLYTEGTGFGGTSGVYRNFLFDDDAKPLYGFTVSNVSSTDCTLTFTEF